MANDVNFWVQFHQEFKPSLPPESDCVDTQVCRIVDGRVETVLVSDSLPQFQYDDCIIHQQIKTGVDFGSHHSIPANGLEGSSKSEKLVENIISQAQSDQTSPEPTPQVPSTPIVEPKTE